MFDKIYRLILSNIESLARATGDDANETDGTEEVGSRPRSNCTSTNLVKLLQEWNRLDRFKDGFLLHTWDQTLDSGSCEICLLATDEVAHTGMYKDGIHNLSRFVHNYARLKENMDQALFEKALREGGSDFLDPDEELTEDHKRLCLVCSSNASSHPREADKPVPKVSEKNAPSLCSDLLFKVDIAADTHHSQKVQKALLNIMPYLEDLRDKMELSLVKPHDDQEACPVCKVVQEGMPSIDTFSSLLDEMSAFQRKQILLRHPPPVDNFMRLLTGICQVRLQLSDEGPWKGLLFQEYEQDSKTPSTSLLYPAEGMSLRSVKPAYRQPSMDSVLFAPISNNKFGFARPVGPEFDVSLVPFWLEKCRHDHGLRCQKQTSAGQPTAMILIDVEKKCLVQVPEGLPPPYLALSYVWGFVKQPTLKANNLDRLQQDGSLDDEPIPRKIRDAMSLTQKSGLRHLWVDALCIVQDDAELRDLQINQMYLIYHQAEATLVAADGGDCSSGLSGLSEYQERPGPESTRLLVDINLARIPKEPRYILEASAWRTRGWTFQEEICSVRSIIFLPGLVIFSCPTAVWREDIHLESKNIARLSCGLNSLPTALGKGDDGSSEERIRIFRGIVKQYTQRTLTRSEDMENAFAGISGMMEELVGPIYHGIPEKYFAQIVGGCWFWDMYCSVRPGFPSWSWTGWIYTKEQADAGIEPLASLGETDGLIQFFKFIGSGVEALSLPKAAAEERRSAIGIQPKLFAQFEPDLSKMNSRHKTMASETSGIPTGIIAFYTSFALLELRAPHGAFTIAIREHRVLNPRTKQQVTSLSLPHDFLKSNGHLQPFVVISSQPGGDKGGQLRLMLVSMEGEICYKVNVTSPRKPVSEREWWDLNPTKKLIVMG